MTDNYHKLIREEFSKQSQNFNKLGQNLSNKDYIEWAVNNLPLNSNQIVLDVAAGTGHLSRAIAPRVKHVKAIDTTSQMLQEGDVAAKATGLKNIDFEIGLAEELPYPDSSFDLVVSRLAIHHFQHPLPALQEMFRVCKTGGTVVIIDMISPEGMELALSYNYFERLRDPSHIRCLSFPEMIDLMKASGLKNISSLPREIEVEVSSWFSVTQTPQDIQNIIINELTKEAKGLRECPTGTRPYFDGDKLKFTQTWVIFSGAK